MSIGIRKLKSEIHRSKHSLDFIDHIKGYLVNEMESTPLGEIYQTDAEVEGVARNHHGHTYSTTMSVAGRHRPSVFRLGVKNKLLFNYIRGTNSQSLNIII